MAICLNAVPSVLNWPGTVVTVTGENSINTWYSVPSSVLDLEIGVATMWLGMSSMGTEANCGALGSGIEPEGKLTRNVLISFLQMYRADCRSLALRTVMLPMG